MNNTAINLRVNDQVKKEAQQVAEELGFSLNSLVNAYLRQLIRTKRVDFAVREDPSPYLIEQLKQSKEDVKRGRVSPTFQSSKEAIAWLNKKGGKA